MVSGAAQITTHTALPVRIPAMAIHVAILKPHYLDAILSGEKTVESRMTQTQQPPFNMVATGERIYFKDSGGPFRAMARAGHVESYLKITPLQFDHLMSRLRPKIGGDDDYWESKRNADYFTFVHLSDVEPAGVGPIYPKSAWKAWHVLDDATDPIFEIALTADAIRNFYLPLPANSDALQIGDIQLQLPDGKTFTTDTYQNQRLRWRGWGPYYHEYEVRPGDTVRLVRVGVDRYRVYFIRHTQADLSWLNPPETPPPEHPPEMPLED